MKMIAKDSLITMHFDLRLKDGSIAESTRSIGRALQFQMGAGVFSEKLEEQLLGRQAGDRLKIMLLPQDAFGEPHPASIYEVPRNKFKAMEIDDHKLEVGMIILFNQPSGTELPGIVRDIAEDEVTIDFNHPLAGQVVLFDIEILDVV